MPWSPLAGGLLSGKFSRDNEKPEGARRATLDFPPVDRERLWRVLDVMRPIADDHLVSVAQVALAWLLAQPHVTSVIIGAKNQEQLLDNIAATELTLSAEQLQAISDASALPSEYPQWMLSRQSADRLGQVNGRAERESRKFHRATISGSVTAAIFQRPFPKGPQTDARGGLPGADDLTAGAIAPAARIRCAHCHPLTAQLSARVDVSRHRYRHFECQGRHRRRQGHGGGAGLRAAQRFPSASRMVRAESCRLVERHQRRGESVAGGDAARP